MSYIGRIETEYFENGRIKSDTLLNENGKETK
jgi:hypothetical protein